jgi:hypothetical protein
MYIYYYVWGLSIAIVAYNIGYRLELIDPIDNPIETILLRFVVPMFVTPFLIWRNENKK